MKRVAGFVLSVAVFAALVLPAQASVPGVFVYHSTLKDAGSVEFVSYPCPYGTPGDGWIGLYNEDLRLRSTVDVRNKSTVAKRVRVRRDVTERIHENDCNYGDGSWWTHTYTLTSGYKTVPAAAWKNVCDGSGCVRVFVYGRVTFKLSKNVTPSHQFLGPNGYRLTANMEVTL